MEALIFHRNKITLCPSDECDQFCHQFLQLQFQFHAVNLCSSSSISSSKLLACLDLVRVLCCLFVYFQLQFQAVCMSRSSCSSVVVPSCLQFQIQYQFYAVFCLFSCLALVFVVVLCFCLSESSCFSSKLSKKTAQPDGIRYSLSYVICLK